VRKPDRAFFERVSELVGAPPSRVAYVGDRVDNDVLPAAAAGMVAVHVRRGPWGRLQRTPAEAALVLDDLASLPDALASLS
jgi:FMN phosphatase YigB (HAD superfamily)